MTNHNHLTVADYFSRVSLEPVYPDSAEIVITLYSQVFDEAATLLRQFPLSITTIDVPFLNTLKVRHNLPPQKDKLAIEFSMEDPYPEHIIDRLIIPNHQLPLFNQVNAKTKTIKIILREKQGIMSNIQVRSEPINVYQPFLLDWQGIVGLMFYLRNATGNRPNEHFLNVLNIRLKEHGPATGIYTEIGYFHRLSENWQAALAAYFQEIRFCLKPNGIPSIGAAKALNNMGVVYKKISDVQRATDCFMLALALNPNYFEALISVAGLIEDEMLSYKCIARAYRIRNRWSGYGNLFKNAAAFWKRKEVDVAQYVASESKKSDLSRPLMQIIPNDIPNLLKKLGI